MPLSEGIFTIPIFIKMEIHIFQAFIGSCGRGNDTHFNDITAAGRYEKLSLLSINTLFISVRHSY
jgi:hypothetical protein